jgi:phage protein D
MSSTNPIFYVTVFPSQADGGGQIDMTERVQSLVYDDQEAQADKLTLQVDNFDLSNLDSPVWKTGNKIEVSWGYEGNMSPPRTVIIQKVTGSLTLNIEALSRGCIMNKVQKVRTFENMSRSDVATQIAEENGYGEDQQFIDDTGEVLEQVTQARMTDAQICRDMARREGFEFYIDFDGFHFHKRKLGQKPLRRFTYYTDLSGDILTWNIENDLYARKAGGIQLQGRDPKTKADIDVKADNVNASGQTSLAPEKTVITGISERDGTATGDLVKDSGSSALGRTTERTADSAKRQALGSFGKSQLNAAILTMDCRGDPAMIAKVVVAIDGIGHTISGNYYVVNIQHKLGSGYTMTMKCRRDGRTAFNNAAAYGEAANNNKSNGAGVTSKGAQNNGQPGGDKPLTAISQRDGSVAFSDTAGRTQQDAPAPAPANDKSDPLGLVHPLNEDAQR